MASAHGGHALTMQSGQVFCLDCSVRVTAAPPPEAVPMKQHDESTFHMVVFRNVRSKERAEVTVQADDEESADDKAWELAESNPELFTWVPVPGGDDYAEVDEVQLSWQEEPEEDEDDDDDEEAL